MNKQDIIKAILKELEGNDVEKMRSSAVQIAAIAIKVLMDLPAASKDHDKKSLYSKEKQVPIVISTPKEIPAKAKPQKVTKKQLLSKTKKQDIPKAEWNKISKYLKDNGKEEADIDRFLILSNKHYPAIRDEWEKSEKKPEEYVRLILAVEMEATKGDDGIDYKKVPELELERVANVEESPSQEEETSDPPDRGSGRLRVAGDSGFHQKHLDNFFAKFWDEHSEGRDKTSCHTTYMKLVRSGKYKPQDLFEKPELVGMPHKPTTTSIGDLDG